MFNVRAACLRFQWWLCRTFRMILRSRARVACRVSFLSEIGPSKLISGLQQIGVARLQVGADHVFAAENHVALDQVLEFADVAGPVILLQNVHQLRGDRPRFAVVFAVVVLEEIVDQVCNVAAPLAQRRHVKVHDINAVEQILAEGAVFNFVFERRLVAQTIRTSTFLSAWAPMRQNWPSCRS